MKLLPSLILFALVGTAFSQPEFVSSPDGIQPRKSPEVAMIATAETTMPITISPEASESLRKVARYVADTLTKMSGKSFQVQESREAQGIVIGTLEQFPDESVRRELEKFGKVKMVDGLPIVEEEDAEGFRKWGGVESFAIRTHAQGVHLIGQTEKGAIHAAARFLELLGVRRFTPSPVWEIVPKQSEIRFDAEEEQAPNYYVRDIWFAFGGGLQTPSGEPKGEEALTDVSVWQWMNHSGRKNSAFEQRTQHMYGSVYRKHKEEINADKEKYWAEIKGHRTGEERKGPGKFCLSQPRMREMITETVLEGFTNKAGDRNFMSSAEPSDGARWCECADCVAMGNISERAFIVANEAAKAAEKKFPKSNMVGVLAYYQHVNPPSFPLNPNLFVLLATRMDQGVMAMPDLLEQWPKRTKNIGVYDYFSTYVWGQDRLRDSSSYVPAASPLKLAAKLRDWYALGYRYICAESMPNFALYTRGYLVANKVMWNLKTDEELVLKDFYEKAFGPAGEVMRKYYELIDPESGRLLHHDTYAKFISLLDEAAELAKGDEAVTARINHLKLFHIGDYFQYRTNTLPREDIEGRKQWVLRMFSLIYQTRYDWVNHRAAWMSSLPNYAKNYNEPDWVMRKNHTPPWMEKDAVDAEELTALWKEVREYFHPQGLEGKIYSDKLIVKENGVGEEEGVTESPTLTIANDGVYFLSQQGEALKFTLTLPKVGRERKSSVWVRDEEGKRIFHKFFENSQEEDTVVEMEIPVPKAGVYSVDIYSAGGSSRIAQATGQHMFTRSMRNLALKGDAYAYFYVPKDVKEIQIYALSRKPGSVIGPDGTPYEIEQKESGVFRLPVSEADRGTVWKTQSRGMCFLNIPNIFSFDTKNILIPDNIP